MIINSLFWIEILELYNAYSGTGSYSRLAGWQTKRVSFEFLKLFIVRIFKLFARFNKVTTLLEQYQYMNAFKLVFSRVLSWLLEA